MKDQSISIHEAHRLELTTGKFIIGIKNGVAMVKYPNKQKFRADAAADGFDIITVDERQAELLWKKSINLSVQIVDITNNERNP